jgi:hypothetical protein
MIAVVKAKHKRAEKEKAKAKKGVAITFDPALVKASEEYKSIQDGVQYLYAVAWSPPTAQHMHRACRPLSQSDLAHVKGFYAGNIFYRHIQVRYLYTAPWQPPISCTAPWQPPIPCTAPWQPPIPCTAPWQPPIPMYGPVDMNNDSHNAVVLV